MNLLSKIAKQSIYLPFIFLFLMTNAKSATHYVVGVENIEYLPYFDGSGADNSDYYGFSQKLLTLFAQQHDLSSTHYQLIASIKNLLTTIMLILNTQIILNGNQVIKLPLVI